MAFTYKSLDGWIMPGTGYFRKLQEHALQMEQEIAELKEQLAVSGSQALQKRAEKWSEKWQDKCIEVGELQKRLIELESQKDAEIMRLQYELEYYKEELKQYQRADNPVKEPVVRGRDPKTGRFDTSVPARDKPYKAWLMKEQGYNPTQIAVKLNISKDTVKRYIRAENAKRGRSDTPDLADDENQGVYLA